MKAFILLLAAALVAGQTSNSTVTYEPTTPAPTITPELATNEKFWSVFTVAVPCALAFILIFVFMRDRYPDTYKPNVGKTLDDADSIMSLFVDVWQSDKVLELAGADAYFFLETIKACLIVCAGLLPAMIIVGSLYAAAPGGVEPKDSENTLALFTMSNLKPGSPYLWAGFLLLVISTAFSLYMLRRAFSHLSEVADAAHGRENPAVYSVMITNIVRPEGEFREFMADMFENDLKALVFCHDVSTLAPLWTDFRSKQRKLKDWTEHENSACGFFGTGTEEEVQATLTEADEAMREIKVEDLEKTQVAIATFGSLRKALECANATMLPAKDGVSGTSLETRMCPFYNDIYWDNLQHSAQTRKTMRSIGFIAYIGLIIASLPLVGFISGLANLNELANESKAFEWYLDLSPAMQATLSGLVPVIILAVYMALAPLILWKIVGIYYPQCKNDQEGDVMGKYADFLVGIGLLGTFLSGTIFGSLGNLTDIDAIYNSLGESVPTQSMYYITYILNAGFFGLGLELSGIVSLIISMAMGGEQPEMMYYTMYPNIIMMMTITLTFTTISPFVILWGTCYFGIAYWVFKYQLLYVYKPKHESYTWKFYPTVYHRLHTGIFISQLVVVGVLAIKGDSEFSYLSPMALLLIIPTYLSYTNSLKQFSCYFQLPSLDTVHKYDQKHGGFECDHKEFLSPMMKTLMRIEPKDEKEPDTVKQENIEVEVVDKVDENSPDQAAVQASSQQDEDAVEMTQKQEEPAADAENENDTAPLI